MHALMSSPVFWLILIGGLALVAVLPTLIALIRGADEIMLIALINVLACATVFGWPVALVMAIKWPRREPLARHYPASKRHPGPRPARRSQRTRPQ